MKNVVIRNIDRFETKELAKLEKLDSFAFSEYDPFLEMRVALKGAPLKVKDFRQLFVENKCRGFVIEKQGLLMGYLIYQAEEGAYRVRRLMVNKEHRNQGFGSTLLDYIFERSMLDGKRNKVVASISEQYMETCAFFAHIGFKVTVELSKTVSDTLHFEHILEEICP